MISMKRNLHTIDRAARLLLGVGCLILTIGKPEIIGDDLINVLIGIFGVVNIWAAIVSNCPVYNMVGLSTYKNKTDGQ